MSESLRERFEREFRVAPEMRMGGGYLSSYYDGMWKGYQAGYKAAQPKWVKITEEIEIGKPNYPTTNDDVWCLLANGHIVRGMFFSRALGWEWDNENGDDADATVTHWSPITPPAPPEQKE